jgi:UDP-2,3-diacylglucosamine pyrophosphatase LpxH
LSNKYVLEGVVIDNKPIFVISDLHIGDGKRKDNFAKNDREKLLDSFLDFVDKEDGRLIILGDFLELWWYKLDNVIASRKHLFDKISEMPVIFVPGNHDNDVLDADKEESTSHPLFRKISQPFIKTIGGRRFKFMHGHEIDPFMSDTIQKYGRIFGSIAPAFRFTNCSGILYSDFVSDLILETGETIVKLWHQVSTDTIDRLQHKAGPILGRQISFIKRALRDKKMLARHFRDKESGMYDVVVAGHTHKPAKLDNWYLNSGSWIGLTNDFLVIYPDGNAEVLNWTAKGPQFNDRLITN